MNKSVDQIPKAMPNCDIRQLPLSPKEAFVLSRIDGNTTVGQIAQFTGIEVDTVLTTIARLRTLGAVHLSSMGSSAIQQSNGVTTDHSKLEIDIDAMFCAEIDRLLEKAQQLNHYEILMISKNAEKKEVKQAYYRLAQKYHPDKYFRKNIGLYREKIEQVFNHLTVAHDTLTNKQKRAEYDAYLHQVDVNIQMSSTETLDIPIDTVASVAQARREALAKKMRGVSHPPGGNSSREDREKPQKRDSDPAAAMQSLRVRYNSALADGLRKQAAYEMRQEKWKEASESLLKVCNEDPTDASSCERLAYCLMKVGVRSKEALHYAKRAVDMVPQIAEYRLTLARMYILHDMTASALSEIERCAQLAQGEPRILSFAHELRKQIEPL